jgi:type II secretory pathway component PulK
MPCKRVGSLETNVAHALVRAVSRLFSTLSGARQGSSVALLDSSRRRGSALLTVLWLTAALAAIGLAVANNVRGETERTSTSVDDTKAYFIARGAIERAQLHMLWGREFFPYGTPAMDLPFPNAQARVEIIPETSKLSLNRAPPEEILRLLIALGLPEDRASAITAAILDWRAPVNPLQPSPFDPLYLAQSPSFLPRHASFLENEELLLVNGITPDLYYGASLDNSRAGLRDCISAFATGGAVDINTARPETFVAVGLTPEDAAAIVQSRAQHPLLDYGELAQLQQSLGPAGARLRLGGQTMYTLKATVRMRQPDGKLSDLRRTVAVLVKFNIPGNRLRKAPGFEVVRWYDRT